MVLVSDGWCLMAGPRFVAVIDMRRSSLRMVINAQDLDLQKCAWQVSVRLPTLLQCLNTCRARQHSAAPRPDDGLDIA